MRDDPPGGGGCTGAGGVNCGDAEHGRRERGRQTEKGGTGSGNGSSSGRCGIVIGRVVQPAVADARESVRTPAVRPGGGIWPSVRMGASSGIVRTARARRREARRAAPNNRPVSGRHAPEPRRAKVEPERGERRDRTERRRRARGKQRRAPAPAVTAAEAAAEAAAEPVPIAERARMQAHRPHHRRRARRAARAERVRRQARGHAAARHTERAAARHAEVRRGGRQRRRHPGSVRSDASLSQPGAQARRAGAAVRSARGDARPGPPRAVHARPCGAPWWFIRARRVVCGCVVRRMRVRRLRTGAGAGEHGGRGVCGGRHAGVGLHGRGARGAAARRGRCSTGISARHVGHDCCCWSQRRRHWKWKMWPQGSFLPTSIGSRQMMHAQPHASSSSSVASGKRSFMFAVSSR